MNLKVLILSALALSSFVESSFSQTPAPKPAAPRPARKPEYDDSILQAMDHGPFYHGSVHGKTIAFKGIAVKLANGQAGYSFDAELIRMADVWSGGYLQIKGERTTGGHPEMSGTRVAGTLIGPGWSKGDDFSDPRAIPIENPNGKPVGNLPRDWAHYQGLYRNGDQVVICYSVGKDQVMELPGYSNKEGMELFTRTIEMNHISEPVTLLIAEDDKAIGFVGEATLPEGSLLKGPAQGNVAVLTVPSSGAPAPEGLMTGILNSPKNSTLETAPKGRILLHLATSDKPVRFQVVITLSKKESLPLFGSFIKAKHELPDIQALCKGGPKLWGNAIALEGKPGTGTGPYVVDNIPVPEQNPYHSWIRCSGVDFFPDGRAAICSLSGDVWIVSGLDADLKEVKWQRFATGLYQPLGLKIVDGAICIRGRDQLTRLHDLNNDGEADWYENLNNDITITDHYHEFVLDLQTDSQGNFYSAKGGNLGQATLPHHGTLFKIDKYGNSLEIVARGLRAPNGLAVGPNDEISVSDNEGNWVPSSRVNLVKKDGFYGHVFNSHTPTPPTSFDAPLFWLPHSYEVDNSSGGQAGVTSDKWGSFKGDMLHTSYGACLLFHVMQEKVDGVPQAAIFKFPLSFDSGIMRARFNPVDGQLYVCGLNVWQSASRTGANRRGAFHRVRYTGEPTMMPAQFHIASKDSISITFTDPLDPVSATDVQNFGVEQWNYKWTSNYGSPEFKVSNPEEKGHDPVEIKSIQLSIDKKTIVLKLEDLKPVMQMKVKYNIKADNGTPMKQEIFNTINKVPGQ
ncbi:MAG: heme-binding protein [Verrucomicrobiales bacterium]|nr:heme-binding protein [Verrucomicrobiales bacterium]